MSDRILGSNPTRCANKKTAYAVFFIVIGDLNIQIRQSSGLSGTGAHTGVPILCEAKANESHPLRQQKRNTFMGVSFLSFLWYT